MPKATRRTQGGTSRRRGGVSGRAGERPRSPRAAGRAWRGALERGEAQARFVLERRRRRDAVRRFAVRGTAGLVVAEGDSWFDYPFYDVLEELEEGFNYATESVAHKGDTVEEMVYDPIQLDKLTRLLQKLKREGRRPKAILLSGGGNDIAGAEFAVLLNHRRSSLPALNAQMLAGLVDERLRAAVVELASAVTHLCREVVGATLPILIHGYDYPVPDGRGYLGGFWILPGPWLEPGFRRKGYEDLRERCTLMATLIDRFNALLGEIAGGPSLEHVQHVDLRGTLSSELAGKAYKKWWNDELHPTERGFRAVAERFHQALAGVR